MQIQAIARIWKDKSKTKKIDSYANIDLAVVFDW